MDLTRAEIETLIAAGVKRGLDEWAASIGVDTTTAAGRSEFRRDMEYTRAWRKAIESARNTTFTTTITIIVAGILGVLGAYLFGGWGKHP